jgi:hypothetical protein
MCDLRTNRRSREGIRVSSPHAGCLCPRPGPGIARTGAMARPTGVGHALATYDRIPIDGREEWVAAAQAKSA